MEEIEFGDFMARAREHYLHACAKHPVFADALCEDLPSAPRKRGQSGPRYRAMRDGASARGECTPSHVLLAEMGEVLDACFDGDYGQAEEELYDCVAVIMRWMDMVRRKRMGGKA